MKINNIGTIAKIREKAEKYKFERMSLLLAIASIFLGACEAEKVELDFDCSSTSISIASEIIESTCNSENGSITLTASGGVSPYTYALGSETNETGLFDALAGGSYSFTITDANGCTADTQLAVSNSDGVNFTDVSITEAGCGSSNGQITISATGGESPYTYEVSGEGTSSDGSYTGLSTGNYTVSVTDQNGCSTSQTVDILSGISLDDDIFPIISSNCAVSGCHADNRSPLLNTKDQIINQAARILSRTSAGTMPPSGSLPQTSIDKIQCWVNDGNPNN